MISPGCLTAMPSASGHWALISPRCSSPARLCLIAVATPREPAPAYRHHDFCEVGNLLEQLEPDCPLAGDDSRIVEGMDEGEVLGLGPLARGLDVALDRIPLQDDFRARFLALVPMSVAGCVLVLMEDSFEQRARIAELLAETEALNWDLDWHPDAPAGSPADSPAGWQPDRHARPGPARRRRPGRS